MEKKKRIVVLGAGESGVGAAVLAQVKGFDVFVSDMSVIQDKYKEQLDRYEIPFEEGKHTPDLILNADEVVKSPGIPDRAPMISQQCSRRFPIAPGNANHAGTSITTGKLYFRNNRNILFT